MTLNNKARVIPYTFKSPLSTFWTHILWPTVNTVNNVDTVNKVNTVNTVKTVNPVITVNTINTINNLVYATLPYDLIFHI